MRHLFFFLLLLCNGLYLTGQVLSVTFSDTRKAFPIVDKNGSATIYYDSKDAKVVGISITALANDIRLITGQTPCISTEEADPSTIRICIGTIGHSKFIDRLIQVGKLDVSTIRNAKERFMISIISYQGKKTVAIAGSDRRGTAYGVFHLSRLMGVSPFVWWADVLPEPHASIFVFGTYISASPSVEYRGIFINDEDWGLQPWAAKWLDKEIQDIGPESYKKVFELLLRLKANYIWPAMHPCTKAFYYYKDNPQIADDYAIVMGSSHCEPLLRNNVFEWNVNFEHEYGHQPGEWRYDLNKEEIYTYWNDRVKESVGYESIFTVGMRGIHDGSMPGPKAIAEKKALLEKIIDDQREILSRNFHQPADQTPQIFVPYKEVLNIYQKGLKLPDDITIIWPDDNHGYIRRLPNDEEQQRKGGHGVYYHLSYWGSPADYLWLSSISPALISFEMHRAYDCDAKKLWILNVGDIKPAEMELQYCMDLAWNIDGNRPEKTTDYLVAWAAETFGKPFARQITEIKQEYYRLAASGKPEHLEAVNFTEQEARERLASYNALTKKANTIRAAIPERLKNAYDELIWYPVTEAKLMNEKILCAKFSRMVTSESKLEAKKWARQARLAFDSIRITTDFYNKKIADGKWDGIMSWHPRNRKVFAMPSTAIDSTATTTERWLEKPCISINAEKLIPARNKAGYCISGLGICGNGWLTSDSTTIDYPLHLPPANYRIVVKWLPTFDVSGKNQLNYAIAIDNEQATTVNIATDIDTEQWKKNVLNGYAAGETFHTVASSEGHLRLRALNAKMVLSRIDIYTTH
jgi:hypothetical protein